MGSWYTHTHTHTHTYLYIYDFVGNKGDQNIIDNEAFSANPFFVKIMFVKIPKMSLFVQVYMVFDIFAYYLPIHALNFKSFLDMLHITTRNTIRSFSISTSTRASTVHKCNVICYPTYSLIFFIKKIYKAKKKSRVEVKKYFL